MYCGYITKIQNVRKHSNADRLQLGECFGNTVVVGLSTLDQELGVYFPVDGCLNEQYASDNNLLVIKNLDGTHSGGFMNPEKRNIKAIKLRGEKSDGLFLPLSSLAPYVDITTLQEGDQITELSHIVICSKYIPYRSNSSQVPNIKKEKQSIEYPLFKEHIDTSQLAYNLGKFQPGDTCYITLKMHGTSGRSGFTEKTTHPKQTLLQRLLHIVPKTVTTWETVTGSRRVILTDFTKGYYNDNNFRKKYHDSFSKKLPQGLHVFYEIVGYTETGTPIMESCENSKISDKAFVKQYGKTTVFNYGCAVGEQDCYVYRMIVITPDGFEIEVPWETTQKICEKWNVKTVPLLDKFLFTTTEDLMERVERFYDGADPIGKTHIREGVVVRIDNREKFTAFKHKNFNFKVLEGIIKDEADAPDIEEAQEVNL